MRRIRQLARTARDNESDFPDAAQAIFQKFNTADYLDSVESPILTL